MSREEYKNALITPHLCEYSSFPEPRLELVEDDGDGLQLLVSKGGEELGVAERGRHGT